MQVLYPRCAGLDVHSKTVVACARIAENEAITYDKRTFATTTTGLLELADWLESFSCTHVAMESTGVYWRPVWHILSERFELILGNAMRIKNVPGRKSDANDAQWIADLLAHGLIQPSFVPPPDIQDLRDLTRTRRQLLHETTRHKQRILKTLEDCNLKPTQVMSDVFGLNGRKILRALTAGETDPSRLADLTDGRLKADKGQIAEALRGRVTSHHRFMLRLHLGQIEGLEEAVRQIEQRVEELLAPFRDKRRRLMAIPGISEVASAALIAELGSDMSRFRSAAHARSWVGLSPGLNESAGKTLSNRTRAGGVWLKPVLVQCALAAVSRKDSYFAAQFRRLRARRGGKKAMVAVAASLLTVAYCILRDGTEYRDLGADYFDKLNRTKLANRFVKRLKELGYDVTVHPAA